MATRILSLSVIALAFGYSSVSRGEILFSAQVDRAEISIDEPLNFKMTLATEDGEKFLNTPSFQAPDFEAQQQFQSTQMSSVYENGRFQTKKSQSFTVLLKPLKVGTLSISNIRITIDSREYSAPNIKVKVNSAPATQGQNSPQILKQQPQKNAVQDLEGKKSFFVRAEVSKEVVYKREQVVVSYFIYKKARTTITEVTQFPLFQGFLREDLEMPVLGTGGRLDFEAVSLNGQVFERALLARYALYPLKEGKLTLDSLGIKADTYSRSSQDEALGNDPFFQFFQQMTPQTFIQKSPPIEVEVQALPLEGQPSDFSGGVGQFQIQAKLNANEIKINEPVTLFITVTGKGNAAAIDEPKPQWPSGLDYYESKGKSKTSAGGTGERVFEILLIPRVLGKMEIPRIPFSFFDPQKKSYILTSTEVISFEVKDGQTPASRFSSSKSIIPSYSEPPLNPDKMELRSLKDPSLANQEGPVVILGIPWWRAMYWLSLLVFSLLAILVFFDLFKRSTVGQRWFKPKKQSLYQQIAFVELTEKIKKKNQSEISSVELVQFFVELNEKTHSLLDRKFGIHSQGLARADLKKHLFSFHAFTEEHWASLEKILESCDRFRFSGSEMSRLQIEEAQALLVASTLQADRLQNLL